MATRGKKEKKYPPMPANWMYKRGDVYMMDLNPYSGSEQGGVRPAIVVQNDDGNFYSNVLLVVPLTTQIKKRNMPTHFILHNRFLSAPSMMIFAPSCSTPVCPNRRSSSSTTQIRRTRKQNFSPRYAADRCVCCWAALPKWEQGPTSRRCS